MFFPQHLSQTSIDSPGHSFPAPHCAQLHIQVRVPHLTCAAPRNWYPSLCHSQTDAFTCLLRSSSQWDISMAKVHLWISGWWGRKEATGQKYALILWGSSKKLSNQSKNTFYERYYLINCQSSSEEILSPQRASHEHAMFWNMNFSKR